MTGAPPYRVLVTGSRDWTDPTVVFGALQATRDAVPDGQRIVVVHGACPTGADALASQWASGETRATGLPVEERHPALWRSGGVFDRSAGCRRNAEMVAAGAHLCLAFIRAGSKGASHCAGLAERAGIPTRRWTA
jgi:hypothetical protein